MNRESILKPLRFRFHHEPDAKTYEPPDGEWWTYDEAVITALPFKQLVAIERQLGGTTIPAAMQGLRDDTIIGRHACSWLAMHIADPDAAGPYEAYWPRVLLIEWQRVPEETPAAADPLDSASSESSPPTD